MSVDCAELKKELLGQARRHGFELAGIAPATPAETAAAYREWLQAGHAGEMHYLARDPDRRSDPRRVWPEAGSILVVGLNYHTWEPDPDASGDRTRGQVARYALGDDYHDVFA
ncbi:MAG TPA: QueG-associated DUF1730 domain-containing protein, partial [Armatimonadota bacterium]|nr:QueG-associated DUF1730 domain-containing protein [Armatimonadota bacterium]